MKTNKLGLFSGVLSVFIATTAMAVQPTLLICQDRECADVKTTLTKKMLHTHLNELFGQNIGKNITFCDAVPGTQVCYEESLKMSADSNILSADIAIPTARILDVNQGNDPLILNMLLDTEVEANKTYPACETAPAKIAIGDSTELSIAIDNFNCSTTGNSKTGLNMGFAVDYIDFDKAVIGAYYTMTVSNALKGNRSGYALIHFEQKPKFDIRLNELPADAEEKEIATEVEKATNTQDNSDTTVSVSTTQMPTQVVSTPQGTTQTTIERTVTVTTSGVTAEPAPVVETVCPICPPEKPCPPCVAEKIKSDSAMRASIAAAAKAEAEAKAAAERALKLAEEAAKATSEYAYKMAQEAEIAQAEAKKAAQMAVQARAKVEGKVAAMECKENIPEQCPVCEQPKCAKTTPVEEAKNIQPVALEKTCETCSARMAPSSSQKMTQTAVVQPKIELPVPTKNTSTKTTVETTTEVVKNGKVIHTDKTTSNSNDNVAHKISKTTPIIVTQQQWQDARGEVYQINSPVMVENVDDTAFYPWPETKSKKSAFEEFADKISDIFYLNGL